LFLGKAGDGTQTRDLMITNQLLYQLSYTGKVNCVKQLTNEILQNQKKFCNPPNRNPAEPETNDAVVLNIKINVDQCLSKWLR